PADTVPLVADQVTAVSLEPVTVAVNCCVAAGGQRCRRGRDADRNRGGSDGDSRRGGLGVVGCACCCDGVSAGRAGPGIETAGRTVRRRGPRAFPPAPSALYGEDGSQPGNTATGRSGIIAGTIQ